LEAINLIAEYVAAVENMTAADLESLEANGCRPEIASGLLLDLPPIGKLRATIYRDGSWQPSDLGRPHYICAVLDGDLIDLIAWKPSNPSMTFSRTGVSSLLNPEAVFQAYLAREPVFVFTDTLEWLRGDCNGIVPLRFDAGLAFHLGDAGLLCQTPELAHRIQATYGLGRPEITYLDTRKAA
jgi:hypothetical protein